MSEQNPHMQPHQDSELNPYEIFSLTNDMLLNKIASGKISGEEVQHLAKLELSGRGVDHLGQNVGFDNAFKAHFPDYKHGFEETE